MSALFPNIPDAFLDWFAAYGRIEPRSRSGITPEGYEVPGVPPNLGRRHAGWV